jgi:hypothetical protein
MYKDNTYITKRCKHAQFICITVNEDSIVICSTVIEDSIVICSTVIEKFYCDCGMMKSSLDPVLSSCII